MTELSDLALAIVVPSQNFDSVVEQGADFLVNNLSEDQRQAIIDTYADTDGAINTPQLVEDLKAFIKDDGKGLDIATPCWVTVTRLSQRRSRRRRLVLFWRIFTRASPQAALKSISPWWKVGSG